MIRLIHRDTNGILKFVTFENTVPPYAILSHTWSPGQEVEYQDILEARAQGRLGYAKIEFCLNQATKDGLAFCWIDTCCIDKTSSAELSTAINSMYRWYQTAAKCYVFLADVYTPQNQDEREQSLLLPAFRESRWFTRGWTLQELLAPKVLEFFSRDGIKLGDRISLGDEIQTITKIPAEALGGKRPLWQYSVEQRMQWADGRITTVEEDMVYCLFGIFQVFLPLIYGEGEQHARFRLEEEIRNQQFVQRSDKQALAPPSSIPFPRNEHFEGRLEELCALRKHFFQDQRLRMAIHGLGGCGKSALALELAYITCNEHADYSIYWVNAASRDSFEFSCRTIAAQLRLSYMPTASNTDIKQLVKQALGSQQSSKWLLIIDNADDIGLLTEVNTSNGARLLDYIPHVEHGKVLFTTRSSKAARSLAQNQVMELNELSRSEASKLLQALVPKTALLHNSEAMAEALKLLCFLPLAIVQAAAFISMNDTSISEYTTLLGRVESRVQVLDESYEDPYRCRDVHSTIARTWLVSFDQIRKEDKLAAEYLSMIACFDRNSIPLSLLPSGDSPLLQTKAIGTLKAYAFMTERLGSAEPNASDRYFDMHRLVHMVLGRWVEAHGDMTVQASKAADRLQELLPFGGLDERAAWASYLPHAISLTRLPVVAPEVFRLPLMWRIGRCQTSLGLFSAGENTFCEMLKLAERTAVLPATDRLSAMSDLALCLNEQRKHAKAESIERLALAGRSKLVGDKHPSTMIHMSNLTLILSSQCKHSEAETLARSTLANRQETLGHEHPATLISMGCLGGLLSHQAKYPEAEVILRQTLLRQQKVLGKEHADAIVTMNNLGRVLRFQGKMQEALSLHERAFASCKHVFGLEHPYTFTNACNLAAALERSRRYDEAETLCKQTVIVQERKLGAQHPDTLMSVFTLAHITACQLRKQDAIELAERACSGFSEILGDDHITTKTCREQCAYLLDPPESARLISGAERQSKFGFRKWSNLFQRRSKVFLEGVEGISQ